MTIAATQCREYIEAKWPATPISRFACRDTASGGISQHSAYDGYDSNALDIFGPGKTAGAADQAYVQTIVDDLTAQLEAWSIRKIIWLDGAAHDNHAHVDFYPMIAMHKWCGGPETPTWEYSPGHVPPTVMTRDPEPENGRYNGEEPAVPEYRGVINVPDKQWARDVVDFGIDTELIVTGDDFVDDWNRDQMTDGRFWTFLKRYDDYLRG